MLNKLNTTYISCRLAEKISPIPAYPLTSVIAPIGYGKTRAIAWWAENFRRKNPEAHLLHQVIVSDSLTACWHSFCRNLRSWPELSSAMESLGFPEETQDRELMLELLRDVWQSSDPPRETFYIVDDLHLLPHPAVSSLFLFLTTHIPSHIHIILLSRNRIFSEAEKMKLGAQLWEITAEDLRIRENDLMEYASRSGIQLRKKQAAWLTGITEGWFSMIYLQMRAYIQNGSWSENTSDIYPLIEEILLHPLSEEQQNFLICLGIPDDFTAEEAEFLWPGGQASQLLRQLTEQNAFITCIRGTYRYHHMLQSCVRQKFSLLPAPERTRYMHRLGLWYKQEHACLPAEICFEQCGDWDELLQTLLIDQARSITGEQKDRILFWYKNCPEKKWKQNPGAMLVLLRKLFSFGLIAEMIHIKHLLLEALSERTDLTQEDKNNFSGEAELIMSFLTFNDITAMSAYHRRACLQITRPVLTMNGGNWTFGSPSVLLLYHRTAGKLDYENMEMRTCMPYFYQVTDGHGNGAEEVMQAETDFYRGQFVDAELHYHLAVRAARRKKQFSLWLAADFLKAQMDLFQGHFAEAETLLREQEDRLLREHRYDLLHTVKICRAWLLSLLGQTEENPLWLEDDARPSPLMKPADAAVELTRSQILLARRKAAEAASRESVVLSACRLYKGMLFGSILAEIQLAAAYNRLNKRKTAQMHLRRALTQAAPDDLFLPFVFFGDSLQECLETLRSEFPDTTEHIFSCSASFHEAKGEILRKYFPDTCLQNFDLTERELSIARLIAQRKTRREIGDALGISEKTVSNRLTIIYEKLHLEGSSRNKREALCSFLEKNQIL